MNSSRLPSIFTLAIPFVLLPSTALVFVNASSLLGREWGYILGFLFYWTVWCVIIPLILLGKNGYLSLFVDKTPIFSQGNRLVVVLFIFISLVTLMLYGKDFIQAPLTLIMVSIPVAIINGVCEELLWRGLYIKIFPDNAWLAILFPTIGFALWHLVPVQIFSVEDKLAFVLSTFLLGLAYGWIAFKTGSAKWTAISHSLNGILALGGFIAPILTDMLMH